jgi:carbon storage regulator
MRRVGEKIIINENITVCVTKIKGNQVMIGIEAPKEVSVQREEVHKRILEEREEKNGNR